MYYVYILRCEDNTLYTGITTDWKRRAEEHFSQGKKCARYTRAHRVKSVEAVWLCEDKSDALRLEYLIKRLKKPQKELAVLKQLPENVLEAMNGSVSRVEEASHTNILTEII